MYKAGARHGDGVRKMVSEGWQERQSKRDRVRAVHAEYLRKWKIKNGIAGRD